MNFSPLSFSNPSRPSPREGTGYSALSKTSDNHISQSLQPRLVLPRRGDAGYSVYRRTVDVLVYQSLPYGGG